MLDVRQGRECLRQSWQQSRRFGICDKHGRLVACARVVTDGERFAWLSDVVVAPDRRGQGLGKTLIAAILDESRLGRVERFLLATEDAHGLYARHGFREPRTGFFMERQRT